MKHLFAALLALICGALVDPASAQTPPAASQSVTEAADHDALRDILKRGTAAINAGRFDDLKPLLYPKFSMTTINQEHVVTTAELEDFLKRWFTGPNRLVKSHKMEPAVNELAQIIDGRFAIARGTNVETYEMMRGVSFTFQSRWTASLIKEQGQWRLAAIHSGIDFTDNPVLRAAASGWTYAAGIGFAAGAIVFALLGWWRRRSA